MSQNTIERVAVVTGSSTGIGYGSALALAEDGFITYATMRNTNKQDNISNNAKEKNLQLKVIELDVDVDDSVKSAIEKIIDDDKRIDLLVNNAGFSLIGAAEDLSSEEICSIFNTNVFGIYRTIRNVVPVMRKQGTGMIINISSLNAILPSPFCSAYIASKFAVEGITQSLRYELMNYGIQVTSIEPGAINTNVADHGLHLAKKIQDGNSVFEKITKEILDKTKEIVSNGANPRIVADLIVTIANTKDPLLRYPVGGDAEKIFDMRKKMNDKDFDNFMINLIREFMTDGSFDLRKDIS